MSPKFKFITADEARTLSHGPLEEQLERLDGLIRDAIKADKNSVRVPQDMININGYNATFKNANVHLALEKAGYIIKVTNIDGQYMSDIWIELRW